MKNIRYFFWGWFGFKLMLLISVGFIDLNLNKITETNTLFYLIYCLVFLIFSGLKLRLLKKFGDYLSITKVEIFLLLLTAFQSKSTFLIVFCFIILAELLHYYKEFCVITPSDKFDGDEFKEED
ncbi:MAG: hypothetical protein ABL872_00590 [Lacibacter sp.]